jgi:hypothetical protein
MPALLLWTCLKLMKPNGLPNETTLSLPIGLLAAPACRTAPSLSHAGYGGSLSVTGPNVWKSCGDAFVLQTRPVLCLMSGVSSPFNDCPLRLLYSLPAS